MPSLSEAVLLPLRRVVMRVGESLDEEAPRAELMDYGGSRGLGRRGGQAVIEPRRVGGVDIPKQQLDAVLGTHSNVSRGKYLKLRGESVDDGVAECYQLRHFQKMTARACFDKDCDDLRAVRCLRGRILVPIILHRPTRQACNALRITNQLLVLVNCYQ